jgi:thiosulfate dehydrogenase (quinone) large subunit
MRNATNYFLSALRILTGWLFLYEGIDKLLESGWSARYYLLGSRWIFSGFFEWIAGSSFLIATVDFINVWGLTGMVQLNNVVSFCATL